jgi:hypothetical protein
MQVSGHRNEGSVKVYCEIQTLQQQKQCSEILGKQIQVASTDPIVLPTRPSQQTDNNNKNEVRY